MWNFLLHIRLKNQFVCCTFRTKWNIDRSVIIDAALISTRMFNTMSTEYHAMILLEWKTGPSLLTKFKYTLLYLILGLLRPKIHPLEFGSVIFMHDNV